MSKHDSHEYMGVPGQPDAEINASNELAQQSAPEYLITLLKGALQSREELLTLPAEERRGTDHAVELVRAALTNELGEDVSLVDGWNMAEVFLDSLDQAETQKKVWNGREAREVVASALQYSLSWPEVSSSNVLPYIKAMTALAKSGSMQAAGRTGHIVLSHHRAIRDIADEPIREEYRKFITDPAIIARLANINHDSEGSFDPDLDNEASLLYGDVLTELGFKQVDDVINNWGYFDNKSIRRIGELEAFEKGSAALLHNFYGIRSFGRHSIDLWKKQYKDHDNVVDEYGIILSAVAKSDRRNAFGLQWRDAEILDRLDIPGRIVEASSDDELERRFRLLRERFGAGKMAFAYFIAHGKPEGFDLGDAYINGETDISYMRGVLGENPVIVLASCSTGQEQGIAQHFSRELGAVVVGPAEPTSVNRAVPVRTSAGLKIEPEFARSTDDWGEVFPIEAVLYMSGERIPPDDQRYTEYSKELTTSQR